MCLYFHSTCSRVLSVFSTKAPTWSSCFLLLTPHFIIRLTGRFKLSQPTSFFHVWLTDSTQAHLSARHRGIVGSCGVVWRETERRWVRGSWENDQYFLSCSRHANEIVSPVCEISSGIERGQERTNDRAINENEEVRWEGKTPEWLMDATRLSARILSKAL